MGFWAWVIIGLCAWVVIIVLMLGTFMVGNPREKPKS